MLLSTCEYLRNEPPVNPELVLDPWECCMMRLELDRDRDRDGSEREVA